MKKNFWNDVASKGAILGVLMLASHIFEQVMMLNGNMTKLGLVSAEMFVVFGIFVYLLFRFTKKHSLQYSAEEGFSFGQAFGYVLTLSLFTSIIVGLGSYIFRHFIIGYAEYINGIINMYTNVLSAAQIPAQMVGTYEQMLDQVASQPEPGILSTISSSVWSYILIGSFAGLIIAAIVKREPNIFGDEIE